MNRRQFLAAATVGATSVCIAPSAYADPVDVRKAVVTVKASGLLRNTDPANATVGTGFLISRNGYIVTSQHLIGMLGDIDPGSLRITIETEAFTVPIPAKSLHQDPVADILVLYAPLGSRSFSTLKAARQARNTVKQGITPIYTAGYPAGYGYSVAPGVIKSFELIDPPLPFWATDMTFKGGQSGSPIYLADGSVIGIAKGDDRDATQIGIIVPTALVPANYWDDNIAGPANLEDVEAAPRLIITTTKPRSRIEPIPFSAAGCVAASTQPFEIPATPGWKIGSSQPLVQVYSSGGANFAVTILEQTEKVVRGQVEMSAARCSEAPRFKASIVFIETPDLAASSNGAVVSDTVLTKRGEIPLGAKNLQGLSAILRTDDGNSRAVQLKPEDLKNVGGVLSVNAERVLARFPGG